MSMKTQGWTSDGDDESGKKKSKEGALALTLAP